MTRIIIDDALKAKLQHLSALAILSNAQGNTIASVTPPIPNPISINLRAMSKSRHTSLAMTQRTALEKFDTSLGVSDVAPRMAPARGYKILSPISCSETQGTGFFISSARQFFISNPRHFLSAPLDGLESNLSVQPPNSRESQVWPSPVFVAPPGVVFFLGDFCPQLVIPAAECLAYARAIQPLTLFSFRSLPCTAILANTPCRGGIFS